MLVGVVEVVGQTGARTALAVRKGGLADAAPRISKGNGLLTVGDYTQAGRYAAGLDVVQSAGGQTAPSLFECGSLILNCRPSARCPIGSLDFTQADWAEQYGEFCPEFTRRKINTIRTTFLLPGRESSKTGRGQ